MLIASDADTQRMNVNEIISIFHNTEKEMNISVGMNKNKKFYMVAYIN